MTFKAIKRALLLVALVALAGVSSFGALLAAPGAQAERQAMFGEVVSNDAGVLTLALKSGETTTVTVVDETELRVPDVEAPTSADIPVGARVALVAESREERLVVTKLQVIPSRVRQRHITLTVIDVVDNTVIAETENGAEVIVELEFEPTEDLVGQVVTFVGVQVDATRFRARSATSIRKIVERLENHATRNKERVEAAVEERGKQEARERLAEVKARLEETVKRQLDRFTEVLVKSPN